MTRDRDLAAYGSVLGSGFLEFLRGLEPGEHWIDAGAGEARAMRDYLASSSGGDAARLTALGLGPLPDALPSELRYLAGVAVEDLDTCALQPAALVTDVYGPLQYSTRPDRVLEQYARLLVTGGRLWIANPATTFVATGAGEVELAEWMQSLDAFHPAGEQSSGRRMRDLAFVRSAAPARVPTLELTLNLAGPPPLRRFRAGLVTS